MPDRNCFDFDADGDADLLDFATLQSGYRGFLETIPELRMLRSACPG